VAPRLTISETISKAPGSGIRAVFSRAASIPGCIRLEVGQPDFRTPEHVCQAAARAIEEGWHGYTPMKGLPSLLERLSGKLSRVNGLDRRLDQIMVGSGGAGVIAAAIYAICDPGDEVLTPNPGWPNYLTMLALAHAQPVLYPCPAQLEYLPDLDHLKRLITPRTRALVVNSPNNPTGAVYPSALLRSLGELAERHGLWIVSDECYDQIVLDGGTAAPTMAAHANPDRVISAFTFSKSFAMTGWRVGYGTGPQEVVTAMTKVLEATSSCVSTIGQKAAEAALDGPQDCVAEMTSTYRRRRELAADILQEAGLFTALPHGAFYIMADISASGLDSAAFANSLLTKRQVSVAPGIAFGSQGEGAVRISLASSNQALRAGLSRMCELTLSKK
jgi:aspartate aminotransferase